MNDVKRVYMGVMVIIFALSFIFIASAAFADDHITLERVHHDQRIHTMFVLLYNHDVHKFNCYEIFETNLIDALKIKNEAILMRYENTPYMYHDLFHEEQYGF